MLGARRLIGHSRLHLAGSQVRCLSSSKLIADEDLLNFLMYDVLKVEKELFQQPRYDHLSREVVDSAMATSIKLGVEKMAPHYRRNDVEEPSWSPETGVKINPEVGNALEAFQATGFLSAHADFEHGGMQFPTVVMNSLFLPLYSANVSTMTFPFLTIAAGNMLAAKGSEKQIKKYLLPMLEGTSTGTMNLSEPQAGSSLGDITTKAFKRGDGKYNLKGTKMWISGGEIPESFGPYNNVTHMVLAKVADPKNPDKTLPGTKGISLFITTKYRLNEDGSPGEKNGIELAGLNHKLGWRGITNTVLNYGESNETIAELIGEEGQGLATMFLMMNEARITIGICASALGYAGYAKSLEYARERKQGRLASSKDPTKDQTPIVNHSDVKRMLLVQKAYVEGSIALCLYGSLLVDKLSAGENSSTAETAMLLDTLTPIIKSWPSEWALEANKWAIQIHGGYGYTRDYDVELIYRDNRLNMIHEGTNGIQSLDLLGRKVGAKGGEGFRVLERTLRSSIDAAKEAASAQGLSEIGKAQLLRHANNLDEAVNRLAETTAVLLKAGKSDADLMLANSHEYLNMTGHIVIAWQWLLMETAAANKLSTATAETPFLKGRFAAADYFFTHELPKTKVQSDLLCSLNRVNIDTEDAWL